jgi:SAM-dependent methyltransferase
MPDRRPQVTAQKRFLEERESLARMDLKRRFEYIFDTNLWGGEESRSGVGSALLETQTVRNQLPALLREIGARSVLDVPCGDFRWLSEVELGVPYIGADIVKRLVRANTDAFGSPDRRFVCLDLTRDALPEADVVLCRDCLVHLSYANIRRALENVKRSGAPFLLMTNFLSLERNDDIEDGDWRPLNFQSPPFSLKAPDRVIVEHCTEAEGAYSDKSLGLWRVSDLP